MRISSFDTRKIETETARGALDLTRENPELTRENAF
jgi:hypothetical protein